MASSFYNFYYPGDCQSVKLIEVLGDGNCFFRELVASVVGYDHDIDHFKLRFQMTSEVMKNKDFYSQPSIRTSLGGDTLDEVVLSLSQNGKHMDPKHSLIYCNMTQKCVAVHSFTRPMLYKGVQAQDHTNLTGFWVPTRHGLLQDIKKENIVHICWHGHEGSNHFSGLQNVGHVPYSLFPKTSLFQCLSGAAQDSFHNSSYRDQRENANFYAGMEISLLDIPPDTIDKN